MKDLHCNFFRFIGAEGDISNQYNFIIDSPTQHFRNCEAFEIVILKGLLYQDHVKILVSELPNLAKREMLRRIKGSYPRVFLILKNAFEADISGREVTFV